MDAVDTQNIVETPEPVLFIRPPGREQYFELLSPYFLETDLEEIQTAYAFSKHGHAKQVRASGERYFDHPKAVSLIIFQEFGILDRKSIVAALLHDIMEDSFILTEKRIVLNFGKETAFVVKLLTKDDEDLYYMRLKQCVVWRAILVKIADRIHNMRTLGARPKEKQLEQVKETHEHFFDLCDALERIIPKKWKTTVHKMRSELRELCRKYE